MNFVKIKNDVKWHQMAEIGIETKQKSMYNYINIISIGMGGITKWTKES